MNLKKLLLGVGMGLSMSILPLQAQRVADISAGSPKLNTEAYNTTSNIPKPASSPYAIYDLQAHKIRRNGKERKAVPAGYVELRDSSLYLSLFFGMYQLLFTQNNDTLFTSYQYINTLFGSNQSDKYIESVTDSTRLETITFFGKENTEKKRYLDTAYTVQYQPIIALINQFIRNKNPADAKVICFGKTYEIPLQDSAISENVESTKANISTILGDETDFVHLEDPVLFYSVIQDSIKLPYYLEGQAIIQHVPFYLSFLKGHWRVTGELVK